MHAQQTVGESSTQTYLHGDLIDSTILTTDGAGAAANTLAYTAFGEPITAGGVGVPPANFGTRYQYAGGWGYESDLLVLNGASGTAPITLQHVGWRWYQPDIGRFVQRDPIGVLGGLNVYVYTANDPIAAADPGGLQNRKGERGQQGDKRPSDLPEGWHKWTPEKRGEYCRGKIAAPLSAKNGLAWKAWYKVCRGFGTAMCIVGFILNRGDSASGLVNPTLVPDDHLGPVWGLDWLVDLQRRLRELFGGELEQPDIGRGIIRVDGRLPDARGDPEAGRARRLCPARCTI